MNKKIATVLIVAIIALSIVSYIPVSSATDTLVVNAGSDQSGNQGLTGIHPDSTGYISARADKVTVSVTCYPTLLTMKLFKYGSPTATVYGAIWDTNKNVLQISTNSCSVSSLGTSTSGYTTSFTFAGNLELHPATTYYVGFFVDSATLIDNTNVARYRGTSSNGYATGYQYYSGAWHGSSYLIYEQLYATLTLPTGTPIPTPTTPASTATPDGMSTVINTVITPANILLFIALLIIIIPAILGAKFAGGWGFLAGLNVGVILVVVFSVIDYALWIAVLIGMVDAVAVIRGMTGAGKADTVTKGE